MKKTFLLAYLLLTGLFLNAQKIAWLQGKWTGTGNKPNALTQSTWFIELTCKGTTCKINYPSFPCGGKWQLQKVENSRATFIEKLSFGKDKCMDNGKVIVQLMDNNYCDLTYYDGTIIIATARIKKEMP